MRSIYSDFTTRYAHILKNMLYVVALHGQCTRALTFENVRVCGCCSLSALCGRCCVSGFLNLWPSLSFYFCVYFFNLWPLLSFCSIVLISPAAAPKIWGEVFSSTIPCAFICECILHANNSRDIGPLSLPPSLSPCLPASLPPCLPASLQLTKKIIITPN